jgi:soluble lytic murein transglycosylase
MLYRKIGKVFLLCPLVFVSLFASAPADISFFNDKPKGLVKDFYIYRYLQEPTTSSKDANALLGETSRMSMKLFYAYASRINEPNFKRTAECLKMRLPTLLKQDTDCLAIKFSPYLATKMDKKELKKVEEELSAYKISKSLHVFYSNAPFDAMKNGNNGLFFEIFNHVGSSYRRTFLDKELSTKKIQELQSDSRINKTINYIVTDNKMKNFNKSLLHVDRFEKVLTEDSLFFLGLNALKLGHSALAMDYLEKAYEKAYYRMDKDKILFWQYKISKDEKYKKELGNSFDINIYTLLVGVKTKNIKTPVADKKNPDYDEQDPFGWTNLLKEVKNKDSAQLEIRAQKYLYTNTLPLYAYLMERASHYKDHYFPMPYYKYLKNYDNKRIALILAIARQESRLVPSALSHSYALGMMQFMPFLAEAIAKKQKFQDFDLDNMFSPETAYMFANIHLNYLEKYLHNPLLIAYAYNGGIGFTKRLLKSGTFEEGEYEPYLSMELVPYGESREYAKKVMANYVIYMQILNEKVSINTLMSALTHPSKVDEFRD